MLKCVLACEQVPPAFFKAVYAFGNQEEQPADAGLAGFGRDSSDMREYCSTTHGSLKQNSNKSASGISSVRLNVAQRPAICGPGRRGRFFFLTIKGDGLLREQIQQQARPLLIDPREIGDIAWSEVVEQGPQSGVSSAVVSHGLRAALATHLVYLSWCSQPWDHFIGETGTWVRPILDRTATVPVDVGLNAPVAGVMVHGPGLEVALQQFQFGNLQRLVARHHNVDDAILVLKEANRVAIKLGQCYQDQLKAFHFSNAGLPKFTAELSGFKTLHGAAMQLGRCPTR